MVCCSNGGTLESTNRSLYGEALIFDFGALMDVMLKECDLWPNLIDSLSSHHCHLVLLNGHFESAAFFDLCLSKTTKKLFTEMLSKFSVIIPESEMVLFLKSRSCF